MRTQVLRHYYNQSKDSPPGPPLRSGHPPLRGRDSAGAVRLYAAQRRRRRHSAAMQRLDFAPKVGHT
jgi:hypothetical protein